MSNAARNARATGAITRTSVAVTRTSVAAAGRGNVERNRRRAAPAPLTHAESPRTRARTAETGGPASASPHTRSQSAFAGRGAAALRNAGAGRAAPAAVRTSPRRARLEASTAVLSPRTRRAAAAALPPAEAQEPPGGVAANLQDNFLTEARVTGNDVGGVAPTPTGGGRRRTQRGEGEEGNTLTKAGRNWMIDKCVKEHVFPKQKFATLHGDLDFSNNPHSICRWMASKLNIEEQDVERWWESTKVAVNVSIKRHRNNVIKGTKKLFQDKILTPRNGVFNIESVSRMRSEQTSDEYLDLLDKLAKAVVGYKVYMENRTTAPLTEWFTHTDEAFLMLCLEAYWRKWQHEWIVRRDHGQPAAPPEPATAVESLYTGRSQGTKRSWSKEGLERFNAIMIDVFRDRRQNGTAFNEKVLDAMRQRYNPAAAANNEDDLDEVGLDGTQGRQQTVIYNDFNLDLLLAHAVGGEQQQADDDNIDRVPV